MAKSKPKARVRYDKPSDSFVIEIKGSGEEWLLNASYPCRKSVGGGDSADFLHYSIVNNILEMIAMGYDVYKSDAG